MAESPSHQWGQIIGQEFLEVALEPPLRALAGKHGLFLDTKGERPARSGKKISWVDLYGNTHDLDFVFERGGSDAVRGDPVAFIETAWRRYTKHSRNKAQEIQGAILPLVTTHERHASFIGVVLAGDFTSGALTQLRSLRFRVLHFSYDSIVASFKTVGINAGYEEDTPDADCLVKVKQWKALPAAKRKKLTQQLLTANQSHVDDFLQSLTEAITRQIALISVLPLHGSSCEHDTVDKAILFVEHYDERPATGPPIARYEIQVRYTNGDQVSGTFGAKAAAVGFLRSFQPGVRPAP